MKLSSSFRKFFAVYFAGLLLGGGTRVWLVLYAMDSATGFYNEGGMLAAALNAVLLVCVALLFLFYLLRGTRQDYPVMRGDKFTAFFAVLVGVAIALFQAEILSLPLFSPGVRLAGGWLMVSAVLGWFSAIVFVYVGGRALFGNGQMSGGTLSLVAGVWLTVTLVGNFNAYTTLTTIPDNLLTVLFSVFCVMFFMAHARTLGGVSRKDGRNYAIPAGLTASLFGLLLVVPNWIWAAANSTVSLPAPLLGQFESVFVFVMSVYALLFVRHVCLSMQEV